MKTAKARAKSKPASIRSRYRMCRGEDILLGPGKVDLLDLIQSTGSISEAAKQMEMSYNRAWLHIKVMNAAFEEPLVSSSRGGQSGGGATLTELGVKVLKLWRRMEAEAQKATEKTQSELLRLLRSPA